MGVKKMDDTKKEEFINVAKEALELNKDFLNVMVDHSIKMSRVFAERI